MLENVYVYCLINIITPLTGYQRLFKKNYPMKFVIPYRLYTPLFLNLELVLVFGKTSFIILIFKKGDPSLAVNYRPISLLPSLLIVFEKILSYHLSYYLRTNGILTEHQYGFLSGKSTELQLLYFYGYILKSKNKYMTSVITYIDMAKSFDKVSHSKLLYKLDYYGIRGMYITG